MHPKKLTANGISISKFARSTRSKDFIDSNRTVMLHGQRMRIRLMSTTAAATTTTTLQPIELETTTKRPIPDHCWLTLFMPEDCWGLMCYTYNICV